jgi:hypothetical protein
MVMFRKQPSWKTALCSGLGIKNSMETSDKCDKDSLVLLIEDQLNLLHFVLVVLLLEAGSCQQLDQGALHFLHVKDSALFRINVRCVDDDSLESACGESAWKIISIYLG